MHQGLEYVMDQTLIITTVVTVSLAFLGYIATYLNNLQKSRREDQLERINKQLSELYGPMFSDSARVIL